MGALPSLSVVHLSMRKGIHDLSIGTGVLYERAGQHYIVTAWHCVTGRDTEKTKLIGAKCVAPDNMIVTLAQIYSGEVQGFAESWVRMGFVVPLETESETFYFVHKQGWPRIDVAVVPIFPDQLYRVPIRTIDKQFEATMPMRQLAQQGSLSSDIQPIQRCEGTFAHINCEPQQLIAPGDELFVLGYPRGITDYTGEPIWKRATVASDPMRGWNKQPLFMIDCASRQGMSGAPVVKYSKSGNVQIGGITQIGTGPSALLQGIYVGRIVDTKTEPEDRLFEAQIGRVWKTQVINEIIDGQLRALHSNEFELYPSGITQAITDAWPDDDEYCQKITESTDYLFIFTETVMQNINGRASRAEVEVAVQEHAQTLLSQRTQSTSE